MQSTRSSRRRLRLSAGLVLVTVALLAGFQLVLLLRLRATSTDSRAREAFEIAGAIRDQVTQHFEEHTTASLDVSRDVLHDDEALARHLSRTAFPGAREFFVVRPLEGSRAQVLFFDSVTKRLVTRASAAEMPAIQLAIYPWISAERRRILRAPHASSRIGFHLNLDFFPADRRNRVVLHPVGILDKFAGATGYIVNEEFVQRTLVPQAIAQTLAADRERARNLDVVLYKFSTNETIYGKTPADGRDPLSGARLAYAMGDLAIQVFSAGPTPAQLASRSFAFNVALLAAIAINAISGAILTLRAASEEVRFAELTSDFVSNVTHELRTPLASIRLFAGLVRTAPPGSFEETKTYGAHIEQESIRLSRMVERILELSRVRRGIRQPLSAVVDLADVARSAAALHETQIAAEQVRVTWHLPDEPALIAGERDVLIESVANLIENAIKYSPADRKELVIEVASSDEDAWIAVQDRGVGIRPRDTARIFERFQRADNELTRAVPGTGLGLAIVRENVELNGGTVHVESEPGHGSVFTLRFRLLGKAS